MFLIADNKVILKNINGEFRGRELSAIMGSCNFPFSFIMIMNFMTP